MREECHATEREVRWGYFPLLFFLLAHGFKFRGGVLPLAPSALTTVWVAI
jgi:hypothetical protein